MIQIRPGGAVAPGQYQASELAVGLERVERTPSHPYYGALGVTALGEKQVTFTAILLDGGTFQAVASEAVYRHLEAILARQEI